MSKDAFEKSQKIPRSPPPSPTPTPPLLPPQPQSNPSGPKPKKTSSLPTGKNKARASKREYHCKSCSMPDNNEMVQCDRCNEWHHFSCVNVTADIENKDWFCQKCVSNHTDETQPTSQVLLESSQGATHSNLRPWSPKLPSEIHHPPNTNKPQTSIRDRDRALSINSKSSAKSIKLSIRRLNEERQLNEERCKEYFLEKEKRDREYLDAKYSLLEQQSSDDESDIQSTYKSERLDKWFSEQETHCKKSQLNPHSIAQHNGETTTKVTRESQQMVKPTWNGNETYVDTRVTSAPNIKKNSGVLYNSTRQFQEQVPLREPQRSSDALQLLPCNSNGIRHLSSMQIETRRIISKELPNFAGFSEEWPLFIAAYENSTRACGFSNDENLLRLQKCLKGRALEAVRSKLMYPEQVPNIISTLRMMFGRPEIIIDSLIDKLKSERPPRPDRLDSLVEFALSVENIVDVMQAAGLQSHLNNPSLLRELTDRLPYQIRLNWGIFKLEKRDVNLSIFSAWLYQIAQAACEVTNMARHRPLETKSERKTTSTTFFNASHDQVQNINRAQPSCIICNSDCKSVEECTQFRNLNLKQKWEEIKKHFLCRTCLVQHNNRRCTSNQRCGVNDCSYRHHRILHKNEDYCNIHENENSILFKVLPVTLYNNQIEVKTYAFFDDGSSVTLMDEKLADELQLKGNLEPLHLRWTSNTVRTEKKSRKVSLQISASSSAKKHLLSNVHTVGSLNLPSQTVNFDDLKSRFPYLKGVPIESYEKAKPQLLIGIDQIQLTNSLEHRQGDINQPAAIKTRLGWTVFGPCDNNREESYIYSHVCDCQEEADGKLNELVRQFFAVDGIDSKDSKRLLRGNDLRANSLLESCTQRVDKRFSVPLLWKEERLEMPDSRPSAERRMISLEKRLRRDPTLANNLQSQIREYVAKGYARKLTETEIHNMNDKRIWYLPIFPVVNPNKPAMVRIVWDAAARVNGVSLNSMLLSGPDNLPSLLTILFRFRQRKVAICGDIKEMFHQIKVRESDQNAQRFLWRDSDTGKLEDYVMQVLTFGSTCSPCCAEFIKNKNALEYSSMYPRAASAIIQNHYVDDFLDSVDTEEEAVKLAKEVIHIHAQAGFEIRHFMSNSTYVTEALGKNAAHFDKDFGQRSNVFEAEKILGMWWSSATDEFSFLNNSKKFNSKIFSGECIPTKRDVLKILMSVFDPTGLIGHFMVLLKIILQEVWRQQTQWDEEIHADQLQLWHEWVKLLPLVRQIRINRTYLNDLKFESGCSVELHTFVDASLSAYAAVAYLRVQKGPYIECFLVCSKTRVGPIKQISVPRMELEAAVLGVRLAKIVEKGHSIKIDKWVFWSDSQSVLCWIKNENRTLKQFVMFRVGEILENSNENEWRWVPSEENPADDATKWNLRINLASKSRWYCGTQFLSESKDTWPLCVPQIKEENFQAFTNVIHLEPLVEYTWFSSWKKLRGAMACVYRFLDLKLKRRSSKEIVRLG